MCLSFCPRGGRGAIPAYIAGSIPACLATGLKGGCAIPACIAGGILACLAAGLQGGACSGVPGQGGVAFCYGLLVWPSGLVAF